MTTGLVLHNNNVDVSVPGENILPADTGWITVLSNDQNIQVIQYSDYSTFANTNLQTQSNVVAFTSTAIASTGMLYSGTSLNLTGSMPTLYINCPGSERYGLIFNTNGLRQTVINTNVSCYIVTPEWVPPKVKRGPLIKKSIRSSIKRAMKLISNFGMEDDIKIFLGGNEIEVSHPDSLFKFVLTKYNGNLLRATESTGFSTPYKLELYTKTDIHVANLCVYLEDTPLLDQVFALALFVKTGDEEMILSKANFNLLTSDIELRKNLALANPYLEKKLRVNEIQAPSHEYNPRQCTPDEWEANRNNIYVPCNGLVTVPSNVQIAI
jgi:hypothetical protein